MSSLESIPSPTPQQIATSSLSAIEADLRKIFAKLDTLFDTCDEALQSEMRVENASKISLEADKIRVDMMLKVEALHREGLDREREDHLKALAAMTDASREVMRVEKEEQELWKIKSRAEYEKELAEQDKVLREGEELFMARLKEVSEEEVAAGEELSRGLASNPVSQVQPTVFGPATKWNSSCWGMPECRRGRERQIPVHLPPFKAHSITLAVRPDQLPVLPWIEDARLRRRTFERYIHVHRPITEAEEGNNLLEFLGDRVLKGMIPQIVKEWWPNASPLVHHELDDRLVNNSTLSRIHREYGLISYSHTLSPWDKEHPPSPKWFGDYVEAYIGALSIQMRAEGHHGELKLLSFVKSLFNINVFPQLERHAIDLHVRANRHYVYKGPPKIANVTRSSRLIQAPFPPSQIAVTVPPTVSTLCQADKDLFVPQRHLHKKTGSKTLCETCGQEKP